MWTYLTCPSLLLRDAALRVEIADVAALRPRCRIDRAIDQGWFPRSQRLGEGLREPLRIDGIVTDTAKGFDQLFVARLFHQDGWRGIGVAAGVDIVAAIDAAVVEDDGDDRQVIAADGFDLHAAEAEGAVPFDGHDRLAADDRRADGVAHADAHHSPGPAIKALARHAHVDNVAGDVQRVRPLVDEIDLRVVGEHAFDGTDSTVEIHRVGVGGEVGRHALHVVLLALGELIEPWGTRPYLAWLERRQQCRDGRGDISYDRRSDGTIAIHLGRRDIQLNELRRRRPLRALTVAQQPVQPRADQHH